MDNDFGLEIPAGQLKKTLLLIFPVLVFVAAYWLIGCIFPQSLSDFSRNAFYVWQQTSAVLVQEAIDRSLEQTSCYMIYAGDFLLQDEQLRLVRKRQDWDFLGRTLKPITLVFRFEGSFPKILQNPDSSKIVVPIMEGIQTVLMDAKVSHVHIQDIQLDYDCYTSKLADYCRFLHQLHASLKTHSLSITALPDWLRSPSFPSLVQETDYYVLQVHSLDQPSTIHDDVEIFDRSNLYRYFQLAARISTPYYLALPTYGYRMIFDGKGDFAGLTAEGSQPELRPGYQSRIIMADSTSIIEVLNHLKQSPPRHCLGIVWFRLPVDSDCLNWSWAALQAVMQGREPAVYFNVEQRQPSPGLIELWIHNQGEQNIPKFVRFDIELSSQSILAYDMFNGYKEGPVPNQLTGPAPFLGEPLLAAWYRIDSGTEPIHDFLISPVEIVR